MQIQRNFNLIGNYSLPNKGPKENPIGDAIDKLTISPLQIGTDILDSYMGLVYATMSFPKTFQVAGFAVGAAHGALALGYLMGCPDQTSEVAHRRLSTAFGHALLAAGHISGAAGGGIWSLAPLVGGMVVNTLQDYRDRN